MEDGYRDPNMDGTRIKLSKERVYRRQMAEFVLEIESLWLPSENQISFTRTECSSN